MTELEQLLTLDDDVTLSYISTAEGVRSHLAGRREVLALRQALDAGAIAFEDVQAFARGLVGQFVRGTHSPADAVLAAVVVAIEPLPSGPIEEFLKNLAGVKVAEMPMSPRVARLALRERTVQLTLVTFRELIIAGLIRQDGEPREDRPVRIDSGVDYQNLDLRAA
jgi:hypothetical protein